MHLKQNLIIHTLGPAGTNCEMAARHWIETNNIQGKVALHDTIEDAQAAAKKGNESDLLLGCVVYPDLHNVVFNHLESFELDECFVIPTYEMVLAGTKDIVGVNDSILSHPAPKNLIPEIISPENIMMASSNSKAASLCAEGMSNFCITTLPAAKKNKLNVITNFGTVRMGFSIHKKKSAQVMPIISLQEVGA